MSYFVIWILNLSFKNIVYLWLFKMRSRRVLDLAKYTKELTKHFSSSENILLICHINPDGDAIGSQLALYHYLRTQGKKAEMVSPNNLQEFLKWMDGANRIHIYIRERDTCRKLIADADLIVMLDFNQTNRLGEAEEQINSSAAEKVIIDHHLEPGDFSGLMISDPSKCSTSEIIHELITMLNDGPFINKFYAEALYVGIITDTGNFVHGNYSSRTFRIVADLLDTGIDKERIHNLIYNNFSSDRMRLMGFSLNEKMILLPEYQTAYIALTRNDLAAFKHAKGDTEGFVNMPLSISGIIFSTLFIEKEGFVKLSFRSKGKFPANQFAAEFFSGGGHLNAAGGEYQDTLDNTIRYFRKVLEENFTRFKTSCLG
jgi:bifunctional oligoribonuclease and PAP phosphatase NrnA